MKRLTKIRIVRQGASDAFLPCRAAVVPPDPHLTGGRPPRGRRPAERCHRPAVVHRPGTVKVHLSRIFAKLGITTRTELAAQAAAQDLTSS